MKSGKVQTLEVTYQGVTQSGSRHGFSNVVITGDGTYALVTGGALRPAIFSVVLADSSPYKGEVRLVARDPHFRSGNTYQDGVGTFAKFAAPTGVAISPDSRYALVLDAYNHRVRKVKLNFPKLGEFAPEDHGTVTTLAGSGAGTPAEFAQGDPGTIVAGQDPALAGGGHQDGRGTWARFKLPSRIAATPDFAAAFIIEPGSGSVRVLSINASGSCRACPRTR